MGSRLRGHVFRCALLAALVLEAGSASADEEGDDWSGPDKTLHFGVSASLAAASYAVTANLLDARGSALALAGGFTLAVGAAKEALDLAGLGQPSWKDFTWDAAGTLTGLVVAWGVDLLIRGVAPEHPPFGRPFSWRAPEAPGAAKDRRAVARTF